MTYGLNKVEEMPESKETPVGMSGVGWTTPDGTYVTPEFINAAMRMSQHSCSRGYLVGYPAPPDANYPRSDAFLPGMAIGFFAGIILCLVSWGIAALIMY